MKTELKYNLKKLTVLIILTAVYLFPLSGCAKEQNNNNNQNYTTDADELPEAVRRINSAVNPDYNNNYNIEEMPERISNKSTLRRQSSTKEGYAYGRLILYTGELAKYENIKSIEYSLENCVGSFMDTKEVGEKLSVKEAIMSTESIPYILEGGSQEDVYFSVYYYYDLSHSINEQTKEIQECVKHLRITMKINFDDGSSKTEEYSVLYKSETSSEFSMMRFCRLEK